MMEHAYRLMLNPEEFCSTLRRVIMLTRKTIIVTNTNQGDVSARISPINGSLFDVVTRGTHIPLYLIF